MSSTISFVEYVCGQMESAGRIGFRKMFGEYAIYCDGTVVALVCDNTLFVKPTIAGREFAHDSIEAPPYPRAKNHLVIVDGLDDREWLSELIRITAIGVLQAKAEKRR